MIGHIGLGLAISGLAINLIAWRLNKQWPLPIGTALAGAGMAIAILNLSGALKP